MEMESSIDIPTIGLTSSTCDSQIEIATTENDETFSIVRNKIARHDLQQYFKNFKEYGWIEFYLYNWRKKIRKIAP